MIFIYLFIYLFIIIFNLSSKKKSTYILTIFQKYPKTEVLFLKFSLFFFFFCFCFCFILLEKNCKIIEKS
ncbi:hypothetical protein BCR32DRAFT_108865 [Anaeromyces robustus]|uniref:Uncharacterized protein n=1 Tax=Anaeromyces robustus TaxID=1754192 RepID=A0A1Y1XGT9_9FUNG|nr:hypothetical protein BCR32DRAFT_108865 [Anaeromyces robustus]|eukprot:ORX84961.1 hypothetical protein BCR32DRAFT_108865 [Anaeromyces robustus]